MRDNEKHSEMKEFNELKKASRQFSPKEIIWSFAYDLNSGWRKSKEGGYNVKLSQFKENGSYNLTIDGVEYSPKTQKEVYQILREVDPQWTAYYEEVNSHYYKY